MPDPVMTNALVAFTAVAILIKERIVDVCEEMHFQAIL